MNDHLIRVFTLLCFSLFASEVPGQVLKKTYLDEKNEIRFSYPGDFVVVTGANAKMDTAFGDPGKGIKLLAVRPLSIPAKYHGGYEFNIWVTDDVTNCNAVNSNEEIGQISIIRNEVEPIRNISAGFSHGYTGAEAGRSKSLKLRGYRSVVNAKCWTFQSVTFQISAFDNFRQFDDRIINAGFDRFLDSFKFMNK